jgi:hypothetical protein
MNWSVSCDGPRDKVKEEILAQFESCAKDHEGKPEEEDVKAARDRTLPLIDALDLTPDQYGTDWNGVSVTAHGSHESNDKGVVTASFSVHVSRLHISATVEAPDNEHIQSGEAKKTL